MRISKTIGLVSLTALMSFGAASAGLSAPLTSPRNNLTSDSARVMVDACAAWAKADNLRLTIAIVDIAGELIELKRMEGASVITVEVGPRKAKTALRWRRPTQWAADFVKSGRNELVWLGDFAESGGLPVIVNGEAVGAIGVAGAGPKDQECARVAIQAAAGAKVAEDSFKGLTPGAPPPKPN